MHLCTDGIVAAALVSAELWQSRHRRPSAMCCLCEYAIGWAAGSAPGAYKKTPTTRAALMSHAIGRKTRRPSLGWLRRCTNLQDCRQPYGDRRFTRRVAVDALQQQLRGLRANLERRLHNSGNRRL